MKDWRSAFRRRCAIYPALIIRVGAEHYEEALAQPHVSVFDLTGRPMKGWVVVGPEGYETDEALKSWVERGVDYALSLPAK